MLFQSDDKTEGDDIPKNPVDGLESERQQDGMASLIGQSSPAQMEPSSQTSVDSSPQSPQVGQLVDIPLFVSRVKGFKNNVVFQHLSSGGMLMHFLITNTH